MWTYVKTGVSSSKKLIGPNSVFILRPRYRPLATQFYTQYFWDQNTKIPNFAIFLALYSLKLTEFAICYWLWKIILNCKRKISINFFEKDTCKSINKTMLSFFHFDQLLKYEKTLPTVFRSIYLSVYLCISISIYLSIYLSIYIYIFTIYYTYISNIYIIYYIYTYYIYII